MCLKKLFHRNGTPPKECSQITIKLEQFNFARGCRQNKLTRFRFHFLRRISNSETVTAKNEIRMSLVLLNKYHCTDFVGKEKEGIT